MAFWDNFSETITAKSKEVADKAKTFTDIASLKGQIVSYENTILRKYKEIGHDYYAAHKDDADPEFAEHFNTIKKAERTIEELKKRISELSGTKHCGSCNSDVPNDSVFCPKCGSKMEDDTFFDEEDTDSDVVITEIIEDDSENDSVDKVTEEASENETVSETTDDTVSSSPVVTEIVEEVDEEAVEEN